MNMNAGKVIVTLQTNDGNDAQVCVLPVVPMRGDSFIFRWIAYRVTQVRHTPMLNDDGQWDTKITLILENT